MDCEEIQISAASSDDLSDILELLTAVQLPHDGVAENVGAFLVARNRESHLVGTVGLERHGHTALLRSAAVVPEYQKAGVGSSLTEHLLQRATHEEVEKIVLLTATASEFFARRFGFCETPRDIFDEQLAGSSEWNLPRCSSAVCMSLDLKGVSECSSRECASN